MKRLLLLLLTALMLFSCVGFAEPLPTDEVILDESGDIAQRGDLEVNYGYDYSDPDEVALYLHVFIELPFNYLTKAEARDYGWDSRNGNLWDVTDKMSIGGDVFGNREGLLPNKRGRTWYECDVNYFGGYRGPERIVFSSDGLIYYSPSHYQDFELLYDGWYYDDVLYEDYLEK